MDIGGRVKPAVRTASAVGLILGSPLVRTAGNRPSIVRSDAAPASRSRPS